MAAKSAAGDASGLMDSLGSTTSVIAAGLPSLEESLKLADDVLFVGSCLYDAFGAV